MATYSYPLDHPSSPGIRNVTWRMKRAAAVMESPFTGAQQVLEYDYALWEATVELPPMKRDQAAEWQAFFMKMRGRVGTFLLGDPDAKSARGAITGPVSVEEDASIGDDSISLQTSVLSTDDVFRAGDYIQIGEGSAAKLHMVVNDADTDGAGVVRVDIEPRIKADAAVATAVITDSAKGIFRLDESAQGWDADSASLYGFTFSCKEAL